MYEQVIIKSLKNKLIANELQIKTTRHHKSPKELKNGRYLFWTEQVVLLGGNYSRMEFKRKEVFELILKSVS
ncbi:MAG: hypothetical protein A3G33_06485 [Omnitrophica bacterium RIFCSPLOWO2_12_FULL_44_17]|uniref:Uncharacterized protein n=1 Tax=Candidatus Danuiimicrobium aquiferis TaxID=1801832 RepID=A0A1G1L1E9_9BACT|nr:MAG: hypothetical protein A3B72_05355 [Omnitrophica bacterium RIFCSPHIGHO2_02_FULL_45_28]OGW90000.1 MAG: hypothetical protein A3E74_03430 [Omnitrophica bacterium RIFCSPHIGHO2_12_FULL_44_12]OGW98964.1 MAG: hypothetical protein A3G33_06485 [Omnitrophica bacterium RIFCSPLOWO2_12_FULL_44_17]OGX01588.1 MAG: hypothetical protein A3J12_05935 [Omnitrophica bacterium RIFCSPLOWO2_02_FULL_44_11]